MKLINQLCKLSVSCALLMPLAAFADVNADVQLEKKRPVAIDWQPCYSDLNPNLLCAQYPVPLNHQSRKKNPKTINIALIKLPASNPDKKPLGSLFLNPGGPGASGVGFVRDVGQYLFTREVRDNYDLIGFDPRGINLSSPVTCGLKFEELFSILPPFNFPLSALEEQQKIKSDKTLASLCAKNGNEIINYMSTADVARDLDLLRQAVGDDLLHYVGYSYGSYLGVTYANLFPQKVGRLVVDGVLDPIAWSTGKGWSGWVVPVTTRLESDKHSMATLNEFFRLCDLAGPGNCSFAGNSAARFAQLAERLKVQPQPIVLPDGTNGLLTYNLFISETARALYNSRSWSSFAALLGYVEAQFPPELIGQQYSQVRSELGLENIQVPDDNAIFGFPAVLCSDSDNPAQAEFWPLWADETEKQNGYFGRFWTWGSSICPHWPGSQKTRFTGPFNKRTKNPVLVNSTLYDPATPYSGAKTVARLLPNSRLVSVAGWGHSTPGLSYCADSITAEYLLTGAVPASDTLCQQDILPFPMPESASELADENSSVNKRSLSRTKAVGHEGDSDKVRQAIIRSNLPGAF
ncbi:MAG TPA: alpha/beta hydrolase [Cellvibrio sp.]|nr:alpha/beta hydrolase [Cellvibrio sp.]